MGIDYAESKFTIALGMLAGGTEALQERLRRAYVHSYMHGLHDSEQGDFLPEGLQQRMRLLSDRLNAIPSEDDEGTAQATANAMPDAEAMECAEEMKEITLEVVRISAARHPERWRG